jgi:hypothetical protein
MAVLSVDKKLGLLPLALSATSEQLAGSWILPLGVYRQGD